MKRRSTLILLTLLAVLLVAASTTGQEAGAQPRAVPVEPIKEFDIVPKGHLITHAFEIKNEGTAALEITDVRPACGCTVAKYDRTIAPGATGRINVELKTDSFAGPISKSIAVFTNDAENPKLALVVKAQVKPYLQIAPGYARYNYVQGEEISTIPQTLWAEDGSDFEIVSVKAPYDHMGVSFREAKPDERDEKGSGKQWIVEFDLSPGSPIGPLRSHVEVRTDHPEQQVAKIPISGFVRPRQHLTPETVDFGQLQGESLPMKRTLHFSNFIAAPIETTKIETGYEQITAEVKPAGKTTDAGYRFKVELTIGSEMPKGAFDSTVKIHITDESNPVVELPIKGRIL